MARYKLMGREIEGHDDNIVTLSREEQSRHSPLAVVYETDDRAEADTIIKAGGFFRNRDNFITVETVIDSVNPQAPLSSFPQKGN